MLLFSVYIPFQIATAVVEFATSVYIFHVFCPPGSLFTIFSRNIFTLVILIKSYFNSQRSGNYYLKYDYRKTGCQLIFIDDFV